MMDAVRYLPVLGLALWMVPLLWPIAGGTEDVAALPLSGALKYTFGIWALLVLGAWALWRRPIEQGDADVAPDPHSSDLD
jgi:hypothetical protein